MRKLCLEIRDKDMIDMRTTLLIHIAGGSLGLIAGFLALYSPKGGAFHRRAGAAFVWTMVPMALGGFLISAVEGVAREINIPAALLTMSLVVTAFTTVRPSTRFSRLLDRVAMVLLLSVGITCLAMGIRAISQGESGPALVPWFMFGFAGIIAGWGDVRLLREGTITGSRRIARHLWRMSFSLFIAALSFFIGQAKVIPEPIRIMSLLALPVLLVLLTMLFWLWRLRPRRAPEKFATLMRAWGTTDQSGHEQVHNHDLNCSPWWRGKGRFNNQQENRNE